MAALHSAVCLRSTLATSTTSTRGPKKVSRSPPLRVSCSHESKSKSIAQVFKAVAIPAGLFAQAAASVAATTPNSIADVAFDPSRPLETMDPLTALFIAWIVGTPIGSQLLKMKAEKGREQLLAAGMPEEEIGANWSTMRKQIAAVESGEWKPQSDEAEPSD